MDKYRLTGLEKYIKKQKYKILMSLLSVILILSVISYAMGEENIMLRVNGHEVYSSEVKYFLGEVKGKVLAQVVVDGVALQGEEILEREIQPQKTVRDLWIEAAIEELVKYEVLIDNAEKLGIATREESPLEKLNDFSTKQNETIYGPEMRSSKMVIKEYTTDLKKKMREALFKDLKEDEVEEWLQKNEQLHKKYDDFKIRPLVIKYGNELKDMDNRIKEEKFKLIEEIRRKALKGEEFEKLVEYYSDPIEGMDINGSELFEVIIEGNIVRTLPDYLKFELSQLKNEGVISNIIDTQREFLIFKVEERITAAKPELEEVRNAVEVFLKDEKMEKKITEWTKEVEVEVVGKIEECIEKGIRE